MRRSTVRRIRRGPAFVAEGKGPWDGKPKHLTYTPAAPSKSRNPDADSDPDLLAKVEVVQALAALGVDAGWAVVKGKGLGRARGMLLLMLHSQRRGLPKHRVAWFGRWIAERFFRGEEDRIKFKPIGYTPLRLDAMSAARWKRVLSGFKQPTRC
jgi:hypothetical protein